MRYRQHSIKIIFEHNREDLKDEMDDPDGILLNSVYHVFGTSDRDMESAREWMLGKEKAGLTCYLISDDTDANHILAMPSEYEDLYRLYLRKFRRSGDNILGEIDISNWN